VIYREVTSCPFCGDTLGPWDTGIRPVGPDASGVYDRDETRYSFCRCGGAFQNPAPTDASLAEFYREEYRTVCPESPTRDDKGRRARRIFPYFPQVPGDLLDVGCSVGELMEFARNSGWRVAGVEPNDLGREYCRRFGAVYRNLDEVDKTFDLVTAIHVLEHIPSPVPFLRQMAGVMKPQGTTLVVVPKDGLSAPHVLAMGEPQVRLLFERAGLAITFLEAVATSDTKADIIVRAH